MPTYASMSSSKNLSTSIETRTAKVAAASERLSAAVAFITLEFILSAIFRLNKHSQSFTKIEIARIITETSSKAVLLGAKIFSTELLKSSKPIRIIRNETASDATYSILACPKGCSLSAGFEESLKLIIEMICAAASERLLRASAITATEPAIIPARSLMAKRKRFITTPTIPAMVPIALRVLS